MPRVKRAEAASHPVRLGILRLLKEGPMSQAELARALGLPWGQLQWHLYVLEREGYVKCNKQSRRNYYHLTPIRPPTRSN